MMRGDGGHLEGICGRGLVKTCSESFSFAMASEGLGAFGLALPNKCILIQSCCCKIQMALSGDCSSLSEFGCNHKQLCAFTSQRRRAGPAKRGRGGGTERARERGQSQNEGGTQLPSDRTAVCCGDAWGGGEGNRDAEGWTLVLTGTEYKNGLPLVALPGTNARYVALHLMLYGPSSFLVVFIRFVRLSGSFRGIIIHNFSAKFRMDPLDRRSEKCFHLFCQHTLLAPLKRLYRYVNATAHKLLKRHLTLHWKRDRFHDGEVMGTSRDCWAGHVMCHCHDRHVGSTALHSQRAGTNIELGAREHAAFADTA
eukprot:3650186-Rhodomonas_salina.4